MKLGFKHMDFIRLASVQVHLRHVHTPPSDTEAGGNLRCFTPTFIRRFLMSRSRFSLRGSLSAEPERSLWANVYVRVLRAACCQLKSSNVKRRPELRGRTAHKREDYTGEQNSHCGKRCVCRAESVSANPELLTLICYRRM